MGTTTRFLKEPTNIPMELLNKTLSKKKKSTNKDPNASKILKSFLKPDECIVFVDLENPPLRQMKTFGNCLNVVINKNALLERPKQPAAKPTNDLSNLPAANENVSKATGNSMKSLASFPVTSSYIFENTPNSQNDLSNLLPANENVSKATGYSMKSLASFPASSYIFDNTSNSQNDLSNLPAANENASNATGNSMKSSASFPVTSSYIFNNTSNSQNVLKNRKASHKLFRTKKKGPIKERTETFPPKNPEDLPLIKKASKKIDSIELPRTKKKSQIKKKKEIFPSKNPKDSPLIISDVFVKGVVLNPQKQPLVNVKIEILLNEDILKEVYTSDAGEYEIAFEMMNKNGYHIDASMEGYQTQKTLLKRTTSKNQPRNIKVVNFNLRPEKTIISRGSKTELLINNIKDLENFGYPPEVIQAALSKANNNPELIFNYLP